MNEQAEKLTAGVWLSKMARFAGLGSKTMCNLLISADGAVPLFNMGYKTIAEIISGPPQRVVKVISFIRDENNKKYSQEEGVRLAKSQVILQTWVDKMYPEKLRTIASPPAILYLRGENYREILNLNYSIAIVGTRNPTAYGVAVTKKFVARIAQRGVVVISGMARGIDSLAHQVTLENKGVTIAVFGCGIDVVYPPENASLMNNIIRNGLIMSECPPGTGPLKSNFPARNRIISGLSDCVAVMEASKTSGTMITAGYAGEQGKDLFAVPGSVFSPQSLGTNQLIQDGACVLTNVDDMLWRIPFQTIQNMKQDAIENRFPDVLNDENEKAIRKILLYTEKTIDEISTQLKIPTEKALEIMTHLELDGKIININGRFSLTESYK